MSVTLTIQRHGVWQFDAHGGNVCLLFSLETDICNDWHVWNYGGLESYWRKRPFKASDEAARDQSQWREIAP